jgi:hypothetical protein
MKDLMAFVAGLVFSLGIVGAALAQAPAQTPAPGQTEEKKGEQMKSTGEKAEKKGAKKKGAKTPKKGEKETSGEKKEEEKK